MNPCEMKSKTELKELVEYWATIPDDVIWDMECCAGPLYGLTGATFEGNC